jgi:hypothetical protein
MEQHYFIKYDNHKFEVWYGIASQKYYFAKYPFFWQARLECWWRNRKLTKLREFNDRQAELFSGGSLELPDETAVMEAVK